MQKVSYQVKQQIKLFTIYLSDYSDRWGCAEG